MKKFLSALWNPTRKFFEENVGKLILIGWIIFIIISIIYFYSPLNSLDLPTEEKFAEYERIAKKVMNGEWNPPMVIQESSAESAFIAGGDDRMPANTKGEKEYSNNPDGTNFISSVTIYNTESKYSVYAYRNNPNEEPTIERKTDKLREIYLYISDIFRSLFALVVVIFFGTLIYFSIVLIVFVITTLIIFFISYIISCITKK